MKIKKALVLSLFMILTAITSMGQGVKWFKGSFEQALKKAGEENKLVFLYIGTTW